MGHATTKPARTIFLSLANLQGRDLRDQRLSTLC